MTWKEIHVYYRKFVKILVKSIFILFLLFTVYILSQKIMAKVAPRSRFVNCIFLNTYTCDARPDCYGITIGGTDPNVRSSYGCFSKN